MPKDVREHIMYMIFTRFNTKIPNPENQYSPSDIEWKPLLGPGMNTPLGLWSTERAAYDYIVLDAKKPGRWQHQYKVMQVTITELEPLKIYECAEMGVPLRLASDTE